MLYSSCNLQMIRIVYSVLHSGIASRVIGILLLGEIPVSTNVNYFVLIILYYRAATFLKKDFLVMINLCCKKMNKICMIMRSLMNLITEESMTTRCPKLKGQGEDGMFAIYF